VTTGVDRRRLRRRLPPSRRRLPASSPGPAPPSRSALPAASRRRQLRSARQARDASGQPGPHLLTDTIFFETLPTSRSSPRPPAPRPTWRSAGSRRRPTEADGDGGQALAYDAPFLQRGPARRRRLAAGLEQQLFEGTSDAIASMSPPRSPPTRSTSPAGWTRHAPAILSGLAASPGPLFVNYLDTATSPPGRRSRSHRCGRLRAPERDGLPVFVIMNCLTLLRAPTGTCAAWENGWWSRRGRRGGGDRVHRPLDADGQAALDEAIVKALLVDPQRDPGEALSRASGPSIPRTVPGGGDRLLGAPRRSLDAVAARPEPEARVRPRGYAQAPERDLHARPTSAGDHLERRPRRSPRCNGRTPARARTPRARARSAIPSASPGPASRPRSPEAIATPAGLGQARSPARGASPAGDRAQPDTIATSAVAAAGATSGRP